MSSFLPILATNQQKPNLTFSLFQTGFEFKNITHFLILEGVVVAQENEALLLDVRLSLSFPVPLSQQDNTKTRHTGKWKKNGAKSQGEVQQWHH